MGVSGEDKARLKIGAWELQKQAGLLGRNVGNGVLISGLRGLIFFFFFHVPGSCPVLNDLELGPLGDRGKTLV